MCAYVCAREYNPLQRMYISGVRWNGSNEANYDASSPDELALVAGAKHMGVEFLRRPDLNTIEIGIVNKNMEKIFLSSEEQRWIATKRHESKNEDLIPALGFEVIEALDFDNFRKRMSVIIRDRDGLIKLLTKGADSTVLAAAASGQERDIRFFEDTLADFAREGLRTLVLGYRILSDNELRAFQSTLHDLRVTGCDDVEKYADVYSSIETQLRIVGCTAIDDK